MYSIYMHTSARKLILTIVFIQLFFFNVNQTQALEDIQTITIQPSIELSMPPGGVSSGKLPLINESTSPLTFEFQVRDITVDNNQGIPKIIESDQLQILSQWIKLSQDQITLQPGERTEIEYFVELPPNLLPGGYYTSILYQTSAPENQAQAKVKTQLGTLVYLTVEGEFLKDALLKSFNLPSFQEYGPVNTSFEIQNVGSIHIKPKVTLRINSFMKDEVVVRLPERNIFPGSALLYESPYGKKHMIGMYTVDLEAVYGERDIHKITFQKTVLVFPWKIALLILFIVNGVAFGAGGIIHYMRHKDTSEFPTNGPPHKFPTPRS